MTFDELLNSTNEEGNVYRCDIKIYFGWDLDTERIDSLEKAINEIKRRLNVRN